jgi:hypothetical protein
LFLVMALATACDGAAAVLARVDGGVQDAGSPGDAFAGDANPFDTGTSADALFSIVGVDASGTDAGTTVPGWMTLLAGMHCGPDGPPTPSPFHPRLAVDGTSVSADEQWIACSNNAGYVVYTADLDTRVVSTLTIGVGFTAPIELTASGAHLVVATGTGGSAPSMLTIYDTATGTAGAVIQSVLDFGFAEGPDEATTGSRLVILRSDATGMFIDVRLENDPAGAFGTSHEILRGSWVVFPTLLSEDGRIAVAMGDVGSGSVPQVLDLAALTSTPDPDLGTLFEVGFDGAHGIGYDGWNLAVFDVANPINRTLIPGVARGGSSLPNLTASGGWLYFDNTSTGLMRWRPGDATSETLAATGTISAVTGAGRLVLADTPGRAAGSITTLALDGSDPRSVATWPSIGIGDLSPEGHFVVGADDAAHDGVLVRADGTLRPLPNQYRSQYPAGSAVMDGTVVFRDFSNCLVRGSVADVGGELFACSVHDWTVVLPLRSRHVFLVTGQDAQQSAWLVDPI